MQILDWNVFKTYTMQDPHQNVFKNSDPDLVKTGPNVSHGCMAPEIIQYKESRALSSSPMILSFSHGYSRAPRLGSMHLYFSHGEFRALCLGSMYLSFFQGESRALRLVSMYWSFSHG